MKSKKNEKGSRKVRVEPTSNGIPALN